jgi:MFS family permease
VFRLGGQGTGYLEAVYGFGGVLAGLALGSLGRREHARRTFILGAAASTTAAVLFGLSPMAGMAFACMIAMGIADVLAEVNAVTLVQASAPVEVVGRALGALEATIVAAMLLGALIVGPLIVLLGPRGATVALALIGLGVLGLCQPRLRRLDDALAVRLFLRAVPLFARLSLATLDRLGSCLALEEHPTGAAIVRQGESGEKLYIVEAGDLAVFARAPGDAEGTDGRPVNVLGAMDYFGEIALLRDSPRNATVRALGPVRLYSLRRADFQWLLARSAELRAAVVATEATRNAQREQVLLTRLR